MELNTTNGTFDVSAVAAPRAQAPRPHGEVISPARLQTVDHQRPDGSALVEAGFDGHRVMDASVEPGCGSLLGRLTEGAELARAPLRDGVLVCEGEITEQVGEHVGRR